MQGPAEVRVYMYTSLQHSVLSPLLGAQAGLVM